MKDGGLSNMISTSIGRLADSLMIPAEGREEA